MTIPKPIIVVFVAVLAAAAIAPHGPVGQWLQEMIFTARTNACLPVE